MTVEAATGYVLTYIKDSISVIYFGNFMLPSSDSVIFKIIHKVKSEATELTINGHCVRLE